VLGVKSVVWVQVDEIGVILATVIYFFQIIIHQNFIEFVSCGNRY